MRIPIVDHVMSLVRKPRAAAPKRAMPREDRVRTALASVPMGIAVATADGHWLFVNERFRALVGYTSAELSRTSLACGALYVVCRVAGRLAGGVAARRIRRITIPADASRSLLPPGVFGVALALNAAGVLGPDASVLLGTVVLGTFGAELVAYALGSRRTAA